MSKHLPEFVSLCGSFTDLFDQLGLLSSPGHIADFIVQHRPLDNSILLENAPFWNTAQSQFICEKKSRDEPPWSILIDQLSNALRDRDCRCFD
jgi:hypothetical protein